MSQVLCSLGHADKAAPARDVEPPLSRCLRLNLSNHLSFCHVHIPLHTTPSAFRIRSLLGHESYLYGAARSGDQYHFQWKNSWRTVRCVCIGLSSKKSPARWRQEEAGVPARSSNRAPGYCEFTHPVHIDVPNIDRPLRGQGKSGFPNSHIQRSDYRWALNRRIPRLQILPPDQIKLCQHQMVLHHTQNPTY